MAGPLQLKSTSPGFASFKRLGIFNLIVYIAFNCFIENDLRTSNIPNSYYCRWRRGRFDYNLPAIKGPVRIKPFTCLLQHFGSSSLCKTTCPISRQQIPNALIRLCHSENCWQLKRTIWFIARWADTMVSVSNLNASFDQGSCWSPIWWDEGG